MQYQINPFYLLLHPNDGFYNLRNTKKYTVHIALLIVVLWAAALLIERQLTGFEYNKNRLEQLNMFFILGSSAGLFLLWTIANWSVCTLMDGSGSFHNIIVCSAYSLLPYILTKILVTILSNFLSIDSQAFLKWISYIGIAWSLLLIVIAMMTIHEYTFKTTLLSIVLTVLGIIVIIFLMFLIFTLFQQIFNIVYTIYFEISIRN